VPKSPIKATKDVAVLSAGEVLANLPELPLRAGRPALDSITGFKLLTPGAIGVGIAEAAAGPTYRIIKTNEIDGYEGAAIWEVHPITKIEFP
jgi:hypothetical protein